MTAPEADHPVAPGVDAGEDWTLVEAQRYLAKEADRG